MIEHNTSNNRIAVVFLAATFAVALYATVMDLFPALRISFFASGYRRGFGLANFVFPVFSAGLYLWLRYVSLHPLSNPQPGGPADTEENKRLMSRYADKMLPNITGMMLLMTVGEVLPIPYLMTVVLLWGFYLVVFTLRVFSKMTYNKR